MNQRVDGLQSRPWSKSDSDSLTTVCHHLAFHLVVDIHTLGMVFVDEEHIEPARREHTLEPSLTRPDGQRPAPSSQEKVIVAYCPFS